MSIILNEIYMLSPRCMYLDVTVDTRFLGQLLTGPGVA